MKFIRWGALALGAVALGTVIGWQASISDGHPPPPPAADRPPVVAAVPPNPAGTMTAASVQVPAPAAPSSLSAQVGALIAADTNQSAYDAYQILANASSGVPTWLLPASTGTSFLLRRSTRRAET
jgi:hypothetical protein